MAVQGDVRTTEGPPADTAHGGATIDAGGANESTTVAVQDRVVGERWEELGAGAHLVVREPRTARETTYRGPGWARICVDSQEEAWLAEGGFESSPGSGEAPGAEQWVVTALGVVRYAGSAKVVVEARTGGVSLAVTDGAAFVWPAEDTKVVGANAGDADGGGTSEGWTRVVSGRATLAPRERGRGGPQAAAQAAVAQCSDLAQRARTLAAALLEKPVEAAPPAEPAEQVLTRRLARAACAVAHLRASTLTGGAAPPERLWVTLRQADSAWRALPTPPTDATATQALTGDPPLPGAK